MQSGVPLIAQVNKDRQDTSMNPAAPALQPLGMSAFDDLVQGAQEWRLWGRLGWLDIKRRYRRTLVGPFWSALALFIFVMVLGSVGSGLWSQQSADYLPFLVAGMVVWVMLSNTIIEGGTVFVSGGGLIRQKNFPYSILVYALVWRNLIVFLHNLIVYVVIMLIYMPHSLTPKLLLAIPALLLLMINGVWIVLILGVLTARFRDIQQIVQTIVQVSMFVTPLFWPPDKLTGLRRLVFVVLNPLYHMLSIARDPLLDRTPSLSSYGAVLIITGVGWTAGFLVYRRFRRRIAYWL